MSDSCPRYAAQEATFLLSVGGVCQCLCKWVVASTRGRGSFCLGVFTQIRAYEKKKKQSCVSCLYGFYLNSLLVHRCYAKLCSSLWDARRLDNRWRLAVAMPLIVSDQTFIVSSYLFARKRLPVAECSPENEQTHRQRKQRIGRGVLSSIAKSNKQYPKQ